VLSRYDPSRLLPVWFTNCPNLLRLWFSEIKRVGATEAPSSVCSGRWTTRLSSRREVLIGLVVTEGGTPRCLLDSPPLHCVFICFSLSVVYSDLFSLSLTSRLFHYESPSLTGTHTLTRSFLPISHLPYQPLSFLVDNPILFRFYSVFPCSFLSIPHSLLISLGFLFPLPYFLSDSQISSPRKLMA